jgi:RNA polymerase sigma-70 factor (ECF subfamily)
MDSASHQPRDEELAARTCAGDEQAMAMLFDRYQAVLEAKANRRIVGRVRRRLGASDVAQDAWIAVVAGLSKFEDRGAGSFRRWLGTVLAHRADDAIKRHVKATRRSSRREVSVASSGCAEDPRRSRPTPSLAVARQEERARLHALLQEVSGDDRTVLHLVHEQGMTFAAAGQVMGRSAEATRKLFGRAVLRLGRSVRQAGIRDGRSARE